jgi:chloramphenicol-sensitive protein RarD
MAGRCHRQAGVNTTRQDPTLAASADQRAGAWFALVAYGSWGVVPVYFRWVEFALPAEILAHRIVWSFLLLVLLVSVRQQWRTVVALTWRDLGALALSGGLLAVNWFVFLWALQNGRIVEASLGYYINPLVNMLLGMLVLGERLRGPQWLAVGLASAGVAFELVVRGVLPWAGLTLAISFGFYGLVRKRIRIDSAVGLGVETALLLPFAAGYLALAATAQLDAARIGLLAAGGLVTTLPLVCFAAAAMRLPLVTLGFFQYLAPSITLLVAAYYYDEPMRGTQWVTFGMIWAALVVFSSEAWFRRGRNA